jgi:hypothetical protein
MKWVVVAWVHMRKDIECEDKMRESMEMMTWMITYCDRIEWKLDITTMETPESPQSVSFNGRIVIPYCERMRISHNHHGNYRDPTKCLILKSDSESYWNPEFTHGSPPFTKFPAKMVSALSGSYCSMKYFPWFSNTIMQLYDLI